MIQTEEDAYERTENPRHLLNSFTYRGLAGQHLIDKWLLSDDAAQLARDVQGYLDSLQVWQEAAIVSHVGRCLIAKISRTSSIAHCF